MIGPVFRAAFAGRNARRALVMSMVVVFAAITLPTAADASVPWWHLSIQTRPTVIEPKVAEDAQQLVSVDATGGEFQLTRMNQEKGGAAPALPFDATAGEVEAALEGIYGAGNVTVTRGEGDTSSHHAWLVTYTGGLADQPVVAAGTIETALTGSEKKARVEVRSPGRSDAEIVAVAENVGDEAVNGGRNSVQLSDMLPEHVRAVGVSGWALQAGIGNLAPLTCTLASLTCTFRGMLAPYSQLELRIDVVLEGHAAGPVVVSVAGGGAPSVSSERALREGALSEGPLAQFGLEEYGMAAEEEGGADSVQAGSHPFQLTTAVNLDHGADLTPLMGSKVQSQAAKLPKDIRAELPPGLVGDPQPLPQCSTLQFLTWVERSNQAASDECPADTAVGVATVTVDEPGVLGGDVTIIQPIFNLEPGYGEPARFGFYVAAARVPVLLTTGVRSGPGEDYGITVSALNIQQSVGFLSTTLTFWGDPGDARHDASRGWGCLQHSEGLAGVSCTLSHPQSSTALLTLPTSCAGEQPLSVLADSWPRPMEVLAFEALQPLPAMQGCNQLRLEPAISALPTTDSASSPTGLGFQLNIHDEGITAPEGRAQSQVKKVIVALPEGVTVNPAIAVGLTPCSEAQYLSETASDAPGTGCPEASEIGEVEVESPLLKQRLTGHVFLAKQNENPFHSLLALYVVARSPEAGVLVRIAGKVVPNPVTGQLVSTFDDLPQLPFSSFRLKFRAGQRSPLATPSLCGTYTTHAEVTPWSAPESILTQASSFTVSSGVDGSVCPSGGMPPFSPNVVGGTLNNDAGSFSPLYLKLERKDGEQEITGFASQLPPGLTGRLTGIPMCDEAQIQRVREQTGAQAEAEPACPVASEIGHTIAEAGVGTVLAQAPGKLYLGGPFEGAPFSLVSVTSAKVGPFDLGTVVVHLPLEINPVTAQVTIPQGPADQIPHIMDGIVVHLRAIRVYVDRPEFTINPTSCAPTTLSATVVGSGVDVASTADDQPVTVTNRFQAADCSSLAFKPKLTASTSAHTSRTVGASLHVKVTYPKAALGKDANLASAKVELPRALPSNLKTLKQACLAATFGANPASCPPASVVGHAVVRTPMLPVPLEGPAYFVSEGAEWPELIVVLQGDGVTVELVGHTLIKNGVTSSTFKSTPDVPFESFELTLPEGEYSALDANGNLCHQKPTMPARLVGQNGMVIEQKTKIKVEGCKPAIYVRRKRVDGEAANIVIEVPSAGKLIVSGKGIAERVEREKRKQGGRIAVTVHLKRSAAKQLRQRHRRRLTVRLDFTFTPKHGPTLDGHTKVRLG